MEDGQLKQKRPGKEYILSEKRVTFDELNFEKEK